tara:strand:+ start:217 stop:492 length:276 start_codon:yes stop_codon:yes gene_type:complete
MNKGHKVKRGYATVDPEWGGLDFRRIAEKMTEDGDRMNHSTARNVFLSAMRSIAERAIIDLGGQPTETNVKQISLHPMFQRGVAEVLRDER